MVPRLLRLDNRRLTLRECWYQTRSFNVVVLVLLKLFRVRLSLPPTPYIETLRDFAIDRDALPPGTATRLDPLVTELEGLGYHSPRFYRYASSRAQIELFFAAMVHPRGDSCARAMYVIDHQVNPPKERTLVGIVSLLRTGTWFVTSPVRAEFEPVPNVEVLRIIDAPLSRLAEAHAAALDQRRDRHPPVPILTAAEAEAVSDRYERLSFDHRIRRGLYVPLDEAETSDEVKQSTAAEQASEQVGSEHADVLVELELLQNPKPSLKTALWILGASLVAFVVLGGARCEWGFVLLLIPILLFHEAGHWVAMRLFGYRNLRMFFIPLFGAAVSGQHFNVAGWKKTVVSMAGPAPGVLLGTALAFLSMVVDQPWLERLALLTVVLNAFNLLPFLPLDGGWILNATLFCRRAWLETGFKVMAIVALLLAGARTDDRIWIFLAVAMALTLKSTWRLGRLAERLRASGTVVRSVDSQTIPPETAALLIAAVKSSTAQVRPVKDIARDTLNIFERLNARPPGILATLALLGAYAGILVVGFVGFSVASLAGLKGLDLASAAAAPLIHPPLSVACGDIAVGNDPGPGTVSTNRLLAIGTAPDAEGARSWWTQWKDLAPASVARVGPVLIADYPAESAERIRTAGTMASAAGTNAFTMDLVAISVDLACIPPVGAGGTRLKFDLDGYFSLPIPLNSRPPWATNSETTLEQDRARQVWRDLSRSTESVERDPAMRASRRALFKAYQRGDTNGMDRAVESLEAVQEQLLASREAQWRTNSSEARDPETVALRERFRSQSRMGPLPPELLALLGVVSEQDAVLDPFIRSLAASGTMHVDEGRWVLMGLEFRDPARGLATLVEWLCQHGATEIRIGIHPTADDSQ